MRNIIIMGPPGSGKDTQIEALKLKFDLVMIAGGDIARLLAEKDKKLAEIIAEGGLIDDNLVLDEIDRILGGIDSDKGVVFDGFPRTVYQAERLGQIMIRHNRTLDAALYIELGEAEIVRRLSSRRVCVACGFNVPKGADNCPKCGGRPATRPDDHPAVIMNRIQTFLDKTMPLVSYYRDRGMLYNVNGEQSIKKVTEDILGRLELSEKSKI